MEGALIRRNTVYHYRNYGLDKSRPSHLTHIHIYRSDVVATMPHLHPILRYSESDDCFNKSCYLGYFRCTTGNHSHYISDSTGKPVRMESEIVRVVSLSTSEISQITQLKI